jgi:methyl-accepting chemotaxis protein
MSYRDSSVQTKILVPLVSVLVIGGFVLFIFISQSTKEAMLESSLIDAKDRINQFKLVRKYYTENIVQKVYGSGDVKISSAHRGSEKTIPLPATMIHDLSELMNENRMGLQMKLYSAYPFPSRKDRAIDEFGKAALEYFKTRPDDYFMKTELSKGNEVVRVAVADRMTSETCIGCHNSSPDSPKKDWRLNDVRGVLEVDVPIAYLAESNRALNLRILAILSVIIVLTLAILAAIFRKSTLRPIRNLTAVAKDLAEGSGDLTKRLPVDCDDEVGRASVYINQFIEKIQNIVINIQKTTTQFSSLAEQLSASMTQISKGSEEQTERSAQVASSAQEMSSTITDIAKNTAGAAEAAKETDRVAQAGEEIVSMAVRNMGAIADTTKESSAMVSALSERSTEIGRIVQVIDDIADQTNLLALNAAIEAARAGEQGRGFAVVADEVKKLSERTANAIKEIETMIKGIQEETGRALHSMDSEVAAVQKGVELARKAGDSLSEIKVNVEKVSGMIGQIATAAEEQSTATDQISNDIDSVAVVTRETTSSVQQIAQASQEMMQLIYGLQSIVGMFKVSAVEADVIPMNRKSGPVRKGSPGAASTKA